MLEIGTELYLQRPDESSRRTLHLALIVGKGRQVTVRPADEHPAYAVGVELLAYFEIGTQFVKQAARIMAIGRSGEDDQLLALDLLGEPTPAECRQCYRVSTVISGLTATVNDECCPLTDVSVLGCSIISSSKLQTNEVVALAIVHDGQRYHGDCMVQSRRDLGNGRTRYGLLAVDQRGAQGELRRGLQTMSMALQRDKLRRRAGR